MNFKITVGFQTAQPSWGSLIASGVQHLMFLDVGLPPVTPQVFLTQTLCTLSTLVVVLSHRCIFPNAIIIPTQRKASKFIIPCWNVGYMPSCAVRRRACDSGLRVHEFYRSGILNTRTVIQPQGWVLRAEGRPCSENLVWSPVQWCSKEIFPELRSERGMLGGGRQLQMQGTTISVHLSLSTIAWWVEMPPRISLVD